MSTSRILKHLYSLDISSPDILHHLYCLIQYDEKDQYLTNLQGSDLARLVDFLVFASRCEMSGECIYVKRIAVDDIF